MSCQGPAEDPSSAHVNVALNCLLGILEQVLAVTSSSPVAPLFHVEAELRASLRRELAGVRFSDEDVRRWSSGMSS